MHRMLTGNDYQPVLRALYAHLRDEPPPPSVESKRLLQRARTEITALTKKPPIDAETLESPEVLLVIETLLAELLKPGPRTNKDIAQLAVVLYLGYELSHEIKAHTHPH